MATKKLQRGELTIVVSRQWPFNNLKRIDVNIEDDSLYSRDKISLTKEQAEKLQEALTDVLGYKPEGEGVVS